MAKMRRCTTQNNDTTRRLAVMNIAVRGIKSDLGLEQTDTLHSDASQRES
jgi:type I restriction-modification system DNA methylase subunit